MEFWLTEDELARTWWSYRRAGGIVLSTELLSDPQYDELNSLDAWVESFYVSDASLARLIEILARVAPSEADVAFIGTLVLEDAHDDGPAVPERALEMAQLPQATLDLIRSGYLPWP
jgi:hypothetical protein